jgi:oligopeptide transport system ATP-binding protein
MDNKAYFYPRVYHTSMHREAIILPGEVPSPLHIPSGCRFHLWCPQAKPICAAVDPAPKVMANGHPVACYLY